MAAALPAAGATPIVTPPGVFRGRELTRKDRRLGASLEAVNVILEGGIPRGRISEIIGRRSCGKTSLAAAFIGSATRRSEVVAVIDLANSFDPATMAEAGVELSRVLWVHPGRIGRESEKIEGILEVGVGLKEGMERTFLLERTAKSRGGLNPQAKNFLRAAELVLEAGGFELLVMDFGESALTLASSSALRLARMAERSGTTVLMLVTRPLCGTFAALSLDLAPVRAIFSRSQQQSTQIQRPLQKIVRFSSAGSDKSLCVDPSTTPQKNAAPREMTNRSRESSRAYSTSALFEGIEIKASIRRNKVGRSGLSAQWRSLVNPSDPANYLSAPKSARIV
ncbi:MAG: hypothetical protein ACLQU2_11695 [Candidatus Binataceae bacterium]